MDSARPKSAHPVVIADHLWELFDEMARSMGSDRDALINQAMFMFARVNGFLEPSRASAAASPSASASSKTNPAEHGPALDFSGLPPLPDLPAASPPSGAAGSSSPQEADAISLVPEHEASSVPSEPPESWTGQRGIPSRSPSTTEDDAAHRKVAERVLQTAAELERMIKSRSEPRFQMPGGDGLASLENGAPAQSAEHAGLFIVSEDGHEGKIGKDRFLIGRGKHCDFVISSGKVSREHAVIVREGADYFIEDLGSSNGTWFNKQRIKRRKIADGDEYFICSDKIKLVLR